MLIMNIFTLWNRIRCKLPTEIIIPLKKIAGIYIYYVMASLPHCDFSVINNFYLWSLLFRDTFRIPFKLSEGIYPNIATSPFPLL